MRIVSVVGARPQFVKLAPVSQALRSFSAEFEEIIVHTGQHYDDEMSDIFFKQLNVIKPAVNLGIGSGSQGWQTAAMLEGLEKVLIDLNPNIVLVFGDTNTTLAAVLAAVKLHIPVAHVEAGLRSYNRRMSEEINRIMADAVSDLLFCPTKAAVSNLLRENVYGKVHLVGDVMMDVLQVSLPLISQRTGLFDKLGFAEDTFALATIHRAENTDNAYQLKSIMDFLQNWRLPVVLPMHPRTKKMIAEYQIPLGKNIVCISPLGYLDMLSVMARCSIILTDSGGIQKEAYLLRKPCVTLRKETEWVETVELGWNYLLDVADQKKREEVMSFYPLEGRYDPQLFGDGKAAMKIANFVKEFFMGSN